MQTTTLGRTGLKVSRLGAGLVRLGSLSLDETARAGHILGAALDAGINFFDTAECYRNSEELIGKTVAHRRSEFVLATKAGHAVDANSGRAAGGHWTAQTVRDSIDRSLVRLKTDHVDLLQLHADDISAPLSDGVLQAVVDARDAGKTRFLGYSGENEDAEWAIRTGLFDTLQTAFNLVDQRARHGLFELARSRGIGIIAKRPIANAVWGEALSSDADGGASGTTREGLDRERLERAKAMAALGPIPQVPQDPIALALGFVLAHDDVHTAIVGTGNPEHMLANVEIVAKQLPIPESVVAELHRRFDRLGRDWPAID
jgi:aryl-alcohol dehydrogenase-like predicted oxidoreductase